MQTRQNLEDQVEQSGPETREADLQGQLCAEVFETLFDYRAVKDADVLSEAVADVCGDGRNAGSSSQEGECESKVEEDKRKDQSNVLNQLQASEVRSAEISKDYGLIARG